MTFSPGDTFTAQIGDQRFEDCEVQKMETGSDGQHYYYVTGHEAAIPEQYIVEPAPTPSQPFPKYGAPPINQNPLPSPNNQRTRIKSHRYTFADGRTRFISASDMEQLTVESGLSIEVIEARGYQSTGRQGQFYKWGLSFKGEGMRVPLHSVDGEELAGQMKVKNPTTAKYLSNKGDTSRLDINPIQTITGDQIIVPIEGIKKADALITMHREQNLSHKYLVVAMIGVWGWGSRDRLHDKEWKRQYHEFTPIEDRVYKLSPDWHKIPGIASNKIFFIPDGDVWTNHQGVTYPSLQFVRACLTELDNLPTVIGIPNSGKDGLDDLWGRGDLTLDQLLALFITQSTKQFQTELLFPESNYGKSDSIWQEFEFDPAIPVCEEEFIRWERTPRGGMKKITHTCGKCAPCIKIMLLKFHSNMANVEDKYGKVWHYKTFLDVAEYQNYARSYKTKFGHQPDKSHMLLEGGQPVIFCRMLDKLDGTEQPFLLSDWSDGFLIALFMGQPGKRNSNPIGPNKTDLKMAQPIYKSQPLPQEIRTGSVDTITIINYEIKDLPDEDKWHCWYGYSNQDEFRAMVEKEVENHWALLKGREDENFPRDNVDDYIWEQPTTRIYADKESEFWDMENSPEKWGNITIIPKRETLIIKKPMSYKDTYKITRYVSLYDTTKPNNLAEAMARAKEYY